MKLFLKINYKINTNFVYHDNLCFPIECSLSCKAYYDLVKSNFLKVLKTNTLGE